ncbi:MAG TPA: EpsI family protein, partial [Planctomycetota bacterium]|nr:EpsI family protein [Planctomycetota bacterium]
GAEDDAPAPADGPSLETPAPAHRGPSRLRVAALLGLLALGGAAALGLEGPPLQKTDRTRSIPAEIGPWRGVDIPVDARSRRILGTDDVLMRSYAAPGQRAPVDLYVVHAADSRKVAHPPEICFSGGGFTGEKTDAVLRAGGRSIPAARLLLTRDDATLLVYYWYRLDGRDTASYLDHQLSMLIRLVRRERREGSMIRLSTPVVGRDVAGAEARVAAFAEAAAGELDRRLP